MDLTFKLAEDRPGIGKAGQVITLAATPTDTYDPTEISGYLGGYRNGQMRADDASPIIPVDKEVGKYRNFDKADAFQLVDVKGGHEDEHREINTRSALTDYRLQWKYIGAFVNDVTSRQQGPNVRLDQQAAKRAMRVILMDREKEVWDTLSTSANWNASYVTTLDGTTKWNGGASKDVLGDLMALMEDSDQDVTHFFVNRAVANLILRDTEIAAHMRQFYGDDNVAASYRSVNEVNAQNVSFVIPGLPPFHVVTGKYRNDTTGALLPFLGNDVVAIARPAGMPTDGEDIATSYTLRLKGPGTNGINTRRYRVENRGPEGGDFILVAVCDQPIMTATTVGGLIKGAIQ